MQTILYMAASIDGKTTQNDENVDWVSDSEIERMDNLMKKCGVMLMGRGTYESFGDELPSEQSLMVVMTSSNELLDKKQENVIFVNDTPSNVLNLIESKGFTKVLLAGGEKINSSFLEQDLIDEMRLMIKPIVIGTGKALFSQSENLKKFKLISVEQLDNNVLEVVYKKLTLSTS
ncbi:MAG: dihydrofolate reductase family protein [Microgenomates group bacterium]